MSAEVERRIAAMVEEVEKNQKRLRVFSTGEQIAVALVLDRSLSSRRLHNPRGVERLGPDWTRAALRVQRRRE